jgi:hypothetical protein
MLLRQGQDRLRGILELFYLTVIDVRPLAFRESIHEERLGTATEQDDGPVAFRSALSWPGDPLLDDLTAKVRVDLPVFGPGNSLPQGRISNSFPPGKALKPPGFEDPPSSPCFIL